nr:lignin-forming anionic peroxidase-like [Ipomoea batatas]
MPYNSQNTNFENVFKFHQGKPLVCSSAFPGSLRSTLASIPVANNAFPPGRRRDILLRERSMVAAKDAAVINLLPNPPGTALLPPRLRKIMKPSTRKNILLVYSLILLLTSSQCQGQLSPTFYDKTCPNALNIIRTAVRQAVSSERRMAASLVRLHFHDCFVQGCDASILLDETPTMESEKTALPNLGSARGYDVIEAAKRELEKSCPGIVSCADVLSVAARDASAAVGGPSFASKGLNTRDMVALSGAHTLGQAQCFLFRNRIYDNGTNIDASFASTRRRQCPTDTGNGNLAPLDLVTPNSFDNNYYKNLLQKKGLLQSDQVLFSGGATDSIVSEYARSPRAFQADFALAMIKMSEIQPLTGQNGIIRKVCGALN